MIATFATTEPHYQHHADRLAGQLRALGLDFVLEHMAPFAGSKRETCCHRPQWIRRQLDEHGPVLWFDVDGDVLAPIDVPDGYDVGLAANPPVWRRRRPENPVTAGLAFFNDTAPARAFLDAWAALCAAWRPGQPGSHRRLCQARTQVDYRELVLTPHVARRVVLRGGRGTTEVAL